MQAVMTKVGREGRQYAFSERDVAWLESQGWKREVAPVIPAEPVAVHQEIEAIIEVVTPKKRGRPAKAK